MCREEEGGTGTPSSLCHGSQCKLLMVANPGEVNLAAVNVKVHDVVSNLAKKSRTPGLFATEAIKAAGGGHACAMSDSKKASGGFRDVGNHTTAERLPTCWPLVEQVFHYFVQQVRHACARRNVGTAQADHAHGEAAMRPQAGSPWCIYKL